MAQKRDPRTGRFLPKDWKGSYRDEATGQYKTATGRTTTKEKAVKNVLEYTRRNPEKRRYTRRKTLPDYIPGLAHANKLDPKQKPTDFAIDTANPSGWYIFFADITTDQLDYGGTTKTGLKQISITLGTMRPMDFDAKLQTQAIANGYYGEAYASGTVIGFWRSPKRVR